MRWRHGAVAFAVLAIAGATTETARAERRDGPPTVTVINTDALDGYGTGSAVGPDRALYVPRANDGALLRIDPSTGAARVVGTGLPPKIIPIGGAMDVVFSHGRAYVLVSIAGADLGAPDKVMGIYRLADDGTFSLFADVGSWSSSHPPTDPDFFIPQGVQYAIEAWRDGFVITDAHLGRIIEVDRHGVVGELYAFAKTDAVPLGLETDKGKLLVTKAGPIPHLPSTSKIIEIKGSREPKVVGEWAPTYAGRSGLLAGVKTGHKNRLFGLLQGYWDLPPDPWNEGFPPAENTGEVVEVGKDGYFRTLVSGLNRPTSFEVIGDDVLVVTLDGTIVRIDGV